MLHVALYRPAIPQNTGAIARQCVGMNTHLHLIGPLGFDISDHAVKRAGLDYWPHLTLTHHDDDERFLAWLGGRLPWLVTKHGPTRFDRAPYADDDVLIFGNENTGLPDTWHQRWSNRRVFIPMPGAATGNVRSYNLANAVAIVLAQAGVRAGLF